MSLPNFVDYPGNLAYEQPFIMKQLQLYGFIIEGDTAKMQKVIDERLNFMHDRPNTKYIVASDKILFAFTQSPYLESLVPKYKAMGTFTEITFCSYMFVAECTLKDGEWWAQRILIFIPYILVNTPLTMIGGRENYGFPKTMGEFIIPKDPKVVDKMEVSTIGIKKFNPESSTELYPFITISRDTTAGTQINTTTQGEHSTVLGDIKELWSSLKKFLSPSEEGFHVGFNFIVNEARAAWEKEMSMVFLRQFRDIADPDKAVYQGIIEADAFTTALYNAHILHDDYTVHINHLDTLPIDTDLGLSENTKVSHAFSMLFDASFDDGREVYRAV
jgi:hypothetical protein